MTSEIGYDGFSDSFVKSKMKLDLKNINKFDTLEKYRTFLKEELQRKRT
ncbi:MAG: hypothetical protein O9353_01105 [Bacteroidia bacterium]|nr:hypothetical protein [Bacteroidia bacterium]